MNSFISFILIELYAVYASGLWFSNLAYYAYYAREYELAFEYAKKACEFEEFSSCNVAATYYQKYKDYQNANKLYEKACFKGIDVACFNLALSYEKARGVQRDYKKAKELYEIACDAKIYEACSNLGNLYYQGKGVLQNYKKAKNLYSLSCANNNAPACSNLGYFYYKNKNFTDYMVARYYFQKACDMGLKLACNNLKILEKELQKKQKE